MFDEGGNAPKKKDFVAKITKICLKETIREFWEKYIAGGDKKI